jgi:hypothetical protein
VIGLLTSKGQSSMGNDQDDLVAMPLRTVQRRLTGSVDVVTLMVSVRDDASMDLTGQITWLMGNGAISARVTMTTSRSWIRARLPKPCPAPPR